MLPVARLFAYAYCMDHMPHPDTAFKILTAAQWAQFMADGVFHGAPVDLADGYIHLSTQDQVQGTLDKHFAGQDGLVIAEVNLAQLGESIIWEESRGGALFPHIYGPLLMGAIVGFFDADQSMT
ncbi:MAG: hypothetical protein RLZZ604_158 [Pseudomonadota bacterium]